MRWHVRLRQAWISCSGLVPTVQCFAQTTMSLSAWCRSWLVSCCSTLTSFPDSSQYSSWNRTRRLQQPQFLARTDTDTSRAAAAMAHHDHTAPNADSPAQNSPRNKKGSDPLFGPNIGPCSAGPAWTTTASRKKLITDDLTPEVLAGWVEKSKLVCVFSPVPYVAYAFFCP